MKKLILAVLVCALVIGCSSSDNGDDGGSGGFNFEGTWAFRWTSTGQTIVNVIQQDGNSIRLYQPGEPQTVWTGTCNPGAGTFTARHDVSTGYNEFVGESASGDSMSGYDHVYYNGVEAWRQYWTATRN